ncbi:G1/S-specific cyclin-E2 [Hyla sarda]|uniref:G1/S-specific cyclin-E2 n=1 Tax=Hyla sarda TaxID=327740 RepID=UPI0024C430D6|nr:G1/S-specific cyclin-E2 [Hyla sarda]XP_056378439.1 G1/S-specific cyclin-E2 [Hyla sarda]XP_056378440.1 G1/S-specific cyclin-E2 [Hyla sarda]XP_056378442.1 G1/S-specific cyclin-E2 [Hyla sarda]XP_056378443.1 G1/S-specific cyclin-E2 [Hyla sarda]XP_056378444.1 G1/S-specific cyclin-E2 [Hyla sarda]XP_056378445.1 G1/S-specific cyclin-E2 [Hyla sarda]XP_056378446.1 G1/S-specific cyclin-E2 [Hyla sarda]XP_056378447.1 G1/S-specific cyclin-E2 [Hyla sarda]XP_056378448.1 G1/S-specific cyclin-E2 [Hyla sa
MSRRSGRLQAKHGKDDAENECPSTVAVATRKRKVEEVKPSHDGQWDTKRHNYEIQACWSQITAGGATPCILIETPQKDVPVIPDVSKFTRYRFQNLFISPSPLPDLSWGSSKDVWLKMLSKESKYVHSSRMLQCHSFLNPNMRSILLDWLLEVSEVYSLHRETFYLAQDFFDRFMLTQISVNKSMLQLIGVTSLFIASKLEEIYPPKLHEFAYVTDGACSEDDILEMELIILKALKWELSPVTAIAWLNLFLQVSSLKDNPKLLLPQYSQDQFIQIAQLLDLCILHITSLDFQYRILAAAALYHYTSMAVVTKATGLEWESISECVQWMAPFLRVVQRNPPPKLKSFKKVAEEGRHNIQTHTNYLDMLDNVKVQPAAFLSGLSPVGVSGILTPPKSTEKTPF